MIALVVFLVVVVGYLFCFGLLKRYRWEPATLARLLRSRGLTVLPYTPYVGNFLEIGRLQRAAYASPLPSASDHRYLSRIWPFHFANCASSSSSASGISAVFWLGPRASLSVVNADTAKDISSDVKSYKKFPAAQIAVDRVLGQSLLTTEGEDWERRRRILNPAFSSDKLKAMGADMSVCVMEMINSWTQQAQQSSTGEFELDVFKELSQVSADILSRTSFGSHYKEGRAVFEDQEVLIEATYHDGARFALLPGYRFLPTARNRLCWKLQRRIEKTLRQIVERRIVAVRDGQAASYGEDLLGCILTANSSADGSLLTTQDIMDECKTFFFAGHETTANLLTWAMMLMAVYPDWQDCARAEVLKVHHGAEGHANPRSKLKVLEMILNETLRLYPPVPQLISRVRIKDGDINRRDKSEGLIFCLPPDVRLQIMSGAVHRDKELWGNDADDFRPERFANGIPGACKTSHGFMPFGYGPHMCIGQTFAMLEVKLVLASILERFQFRLSNSYRHAPHHFITLRPQHGMPLLITHHYSTKTQ